jgi:DNA mismatch endonuclease, patch repair protein
MDRVSPAKRSEIMKSVRGRDTRPELAVRSLVHRLGYRFRLRAPKLPGRPDLIFASRRRVIFVHGCFWHSHEGCKNARAPSSRQDYWLPKLEANRQRDARVIRELREAGWDALTVWECELKDRDGLELKIKRFLDDGEA